VVTINTAGTHLYNQRRHGQTELVRVAWSNTKMVYTCVWSGGQSYSKY